MKTSQLENIYLKKLTDKSLKAYNKQKNYVSRCIVECFFDGSDPSTVSDSRKFWKTVKSLLLG